MQESADVLCWLWNTKNAGKLPMLLLLVLPLLLPSLQALTLTRHVHWQLRTPLLAAQRLNARVKAWVLVAALEPWTASALPDSVPAEQQPADQDSGLVCMISRFSWAISLQNGRHDCLVKGLPRTTVERLPRA